jgi:hypothetical protein
MLIKLDNIHYDKYDNYVNKIEIINMTLFWIISLLYTNIFYKLTRMKYSEIIFVLLIATVLTKPIYDFSKSYVTQLTNFNFNDQINKIRQTTNYVSIVHFYKYNGILFI